MQAHAEGPAPIMQMLQGAQVTAILSSAIHLDVFAKLAGAPADAATVAKAIDAPPRSTRILLDALAALGLVAKSGTSYALSPMSTEFLVPDKPTYVGGMANIFANPMMIGALARMPEAIRHDGTILAEHAETPKNPFWETFADSSAGMSFPSAMALDGILREAIAGKTKVRVLDVAAGSGIYGFTLAKHPNVEVTLLDWPNVLDHTRTWGQRLGADASRVRYLPGNLFEIDWGGAYDVVLMSHVYHHFDAPTCASLTKKLGVHVAPGGVAAIQEFLYDAELKNPMGALFAVVMLNWTRHGQTYSAEELRSWLEPAGFSAPAVHASAGMPTSWVVARRAG